MSIKVVLFDLDGTLLPMDQDVFTATYLGLLVKKVAPYGYEPKLLADTIMKGIADMVKNNGEKTNECRFWDRFFSVFGEKPVSELPFFDEFYDNEFDKVQEACGFDERSAKAVSEIKSLGYRVALATNPFFPSVATHKRIKWAGLSHEDFELVTTYENSRFCKPNPDYYRDVISTMGVQPEECLMVGNDAYEDGIAATIGMKVFILTPCLINKTGVDIEKYPNGDISDLVEFIKSL